MASLKEREDLDGANDFIMDQLGEINEEVSPVVNRLLKDDKEDGQLFLDINKIEPNPDQPRKHFSSKGLNDLMQNLLINGLVQPLTVMRSGDTYVLIDGERRWRAMKAADEQGLKSEMFDPKDVPCYLKYDKTNEASNHISIHAFVANEVAEKLNPVERSLAISKLVKSEKYSLGDLVERAAMSKTRVSKHNVVGRWIINNGIEESLYLVNVSFIDLYTLATCKNKPDQLAEDVGEYIDQIKECDDSENKLHLWIGKRCKKPTEKKNVANKESGVFGENNAWTSIIKRDTLTLTIKKVDEEKWIKIKEAVAKILRGEG